MDPASLNDIKKALQTMSAEKLREYCLRMAKYKKENKELLGFILFLEDDILQFTKDVKYEMDQAFAVLNSNTTYLSAKGLRKILKSVNKYIKFSGNKELEVELLLHFCKKMKNAPVRLQSSVVLGNLYSRQVERIYRALDGLHEDKQADYRKDIAAVEPA
jgi:hypothetical protein